MYSDKKIYLAAIVVLAFGIGNSQIKKHMDWFECLSSRIGNSSMENRLENAAQRMLVRGQNQVVRDQNAVVRVQMNMACAQARMAQRQAEMVRKQVEKVQIMNLDQVQRTLILDRQNAIKDVLDGTVAPKIDVNIEIDDKI